MRGDDGTEGQLYIIAKYMAGRGMNLRQGENRDT